MSDVNMGSTEELVEALKMGFEAEFGTKKVAVDLRKRPDGRQEYVVLENESAPERHLQHDQVQRQIPVPQGSHVTYSPRQLAESSPHPSAPPAPQAQGGFIYGDGNPATPGDLVESNDGGTVAEVKLVAGNGVVLNTQDKGNFAVSGGDLLKYRKL